MIELLSKQENLESEKNIKIGFHLLLFLASLVTFFVGTFTGLIGVWLYLAWKISVPEYVKTGHAHTSWWSILILIGAFFLPSVSLKPIAKCFIVWSSFLAPFLWQVCLAAYYIFGEEIFKRLNKINLLFLAAITIPLAPFFNAVGRFAAWLKIPNGIGALYFAGQPLKMFNILFLIVITSLLLHLKRKDHENE